MNQTKDTEPENVIPFIPEGEFYFSKGVEAFRKQKYDMAIKWLNKAIESTQDHILYKCQMSIVYTEIGEYEKASELLQDVLDTSGEEYNDCYYLLANNYAHLGLLNEAKIYAKKYMEKEPNGEFKEEAQRLLEVIEAEVDDLDDDWSEEEELILYQEAVFHHMENREWKQALPLLEEMLSLFPEHRLTIHDYAQALFYSGEQDKAIRLELDELEKRPFALHSHINLAIFYHVTQSIPEYEAHIQRLLNVYPIYEDQKLRIAVALAKTENDESAFRRFRKLSKSKMKGHISYYKWYSIAAYRIGAFEKAQMLKNEGCKLHPNLQKELKTLYLD
ncbi:MAG TPA: hypothetical protein VK111_12810 [Virgibacillus sp.]|nr:hypothetical protein [Virgibacillus sp.]